MMRVGIAADHGGFILKVEVAQTLRGWGTKSWISAHIN